MSDVTVEQKMELVRQVKEQYAKNQNDLSRREQILYGTSFHKTGKSEILSTNEIEDAQQSTSTLGIRFLLAILLFAAFVFLENSGQEIAGFSSTDIYQAMEINYFLSDSSNQDINGLQAP